MDAGEFRGLIASWAQIMERHKEELIRLDGLCGNSDLGLTMSAGFASAAIAAASCADRDIGKLSYLAGKAMSISVPTTMGTLMASGFMNAGKALAGLDKLDELSRALSMGQPLTSAALAAAQGAQRGYEQTYGMLARHGRMAARGESSREYHDPGAAVAALLMRAWADRLTGG